jgi:YfiH family protein
VAPAEQRKEPTLIPADWPAPPGVRAVATTRAGGVSAGRYATLNLGDHVGDEPAAVAANRARLRAALGVAEPLWLRQVHGVRVASAEDFTPGAEADAIDASTPGAVCAVLTADCLPVAFCDETGCHVGMAHAGWRGLAAGVLEATVAAFRVRGIPPGRLLAWIGPGIGPAAYEVGADVRAAFLAADPGAVAGFQANARDRWQLDLPLLARRRLAAAGVTRVWGGHLCTHADPGRFFSHRRDGRCGRQATLVWRV